MTILGLETAHELSDLLAAKQANLLDLANGVAAAMAAVDTNSSPVWTDWLTRYQAALTNWNAVVQTAQSDVEDAQNSLLGWDYTTEEEEWNAVLAAIAPFDTLIPQFQAIPGNPQAHYAQTATPQPTAPDADLSTLNAINTLPVVASGGLLDQAVSAVENAKLPSASTWLIGGAIVGTLVAVFAFKRLL